MIDNAPVVIEAIPSGLPRRRRRCRARKVCGVASNSEIERQPLHGRVVEQMALLAPEDLVAIEALSGIAMDVVRKQIDRPNDRQMRRPPSSSMTRPWK